MSLSPNYHRLKLAHMQEVCLLKRDLKGGGNPIISPVKVIYGTIICEFVKFFLTYNQMLWKPFLNLSKMDPLKLVCVLKKIQCAEY